MKASNDFKKTIKDYLEQRAASDELFAVTYAKPNKSIDECCNYVMDCAKNGGCAGYSDAEVYGWAVHYYDEDDIKNIKPVSGKVIVNHSVGSNENNREVAKKELAATIELTPEEIAEAKKMALENLVDSEREKMLKKTAKKKNEPVTEEITDLFSM